ncbi:MAG: oligopeptide ABC transporter permease OppB [Gammaproteobacteria bacterium]|nr:oligopeptide ABC transporter permease OppB [Gammaproteobacteria bacterium]MDH4315824.1 oligopeptide ABC transporter permease OppB [Gammaproteobacteria bacterium]MDH5215258.1 oligopeptide ABC transporter permease OppB [Gammaproteobacteria bacterium]
MLRYALKRVVGAIPTLFLVVALAFLMVRAAPGGPFDSERVLPPEVAANIQRAYHLDESLPQQFLRYLSGVLHGDLGPSFRYSDYSVGELIRASFPLSARLGILALLLALIVGIAAGLVGAIRRDTFTDRVVSAVAMTGVSVPVIVIAPVLVLVFAVQLGWVPAGWSGGRDVARWILPVIALALPQIAFIARITRSSMIDVLESEFIRTARAQGLQTATIIRHHAMKPALLPLLSYLGPAVVGLITGAIVVEKIFGIPGLGYLFVQGAQNRDFTLILGLVILYGTLIVVFNLAVDLLYGVLDPRIRRR